MTLRPWSVSSSKQVLSNPWLSLREDRCAIGGGEKEIDYYVLECADWTHIVAFNDDNEILVTRLYRHGSGKIGYELPAGCVDKGEEPIQTATRELREETGCVAAEIVPLNILDPNPARQCNKVHTFVARGVKKVGEPAFDPTEEIESEFLPVTELLAKIAAGEFAHALHICSVYMALESVGWLKRAA